MRMQKEIVIGVFIILLISVSFAGVSAITGSMGNARMILYPEVNGFTTTTIEKSILTKNTNDVPINISLEIGEGEKFLELIDKDFILNPNEEKKAEFLVKVRKEGTYNGRINVFFSPIEGKEPGVVLSSTVIIIAKKDQNYKEIDEEEEENKNGKDVENNESGVSVSFGGNPYDNQGGKLANSISLNGFMVGFSFILIAVLGTLIYLMVAKSNKKTKGKKRRVKKSGGVKKRSKKKGKKK